MTTTGCRIKCGVCRGTGNQWSAATDEWGSPLGEEYADACGVCDGAGYLEQPLTHAEAVLTEACDCSVCEGEWDQHDAEAA